MMPKPRTFHLLFALSAGALLSVAILHVWVMDGLVAQGPRDTRLYLRNAEGFPSDRDATLAASIHSVGAAPGDVVEIRAPNINNGAEFHLYVVEGDEAYALTEGREPAHVYVHQFPPAQVLRFTRPPLPEGVVDNASSSRPRLDVAFVARAEDFPGESVVAHLRDWHQEAESDQFVFVLRAPFLAAQRWFPRVETALGLLALAAGAGSFLARRPREEPPATGTGTEAALALAHEAGGYLRSLRDVVALTGVLLLVTFVPAHFFVSDATNGYFLQMPGDVVDGMRVAFYAGYAAVALAWLRYFVAVQRALRRWRRLASVPPLEL